MRQRSTTVYSKKVNSVQQKVKEAKSERTGHVWYAIGLSGAARSQKTSTINLSKPQWAADVAHTGH
jgi:hypothetical protein